MWDNAQTASVSGLYACHGPRGKTRFDPTYRESHLEPARQPVDATASAPGLDYRAFIPFAQTTKERIMTAATATKPTVATATHPACEHHHLAAAQHVAAAYHHMQAIDQHHECHHDAAKTHAETAQTASAAAQKHSMTAAAQSKK